MNIRRILSSVALISFAMWSSDGHRLAAQVNQRAKLWLAISVGQPVYRVAQTGTLQVSFAVVNDGDTIVDPGIGSSHLFINGAEPKDWSFVINNGPRSSYFAALPPGQVLSFGYQLGSRYFGSPGIYTVRWESETFRSPEMTFRVMPDGR